jgi:hypothetical protein
VLAFGSVPIASTPVLERLRIDLPLGRMPVPRRARPQILTYVTYFQRRTAWCWAAVAMSVARFYCPDSTVTQCVIAGRALGRSDCCDEGAVANPCNVQLTLSTALRTVGHFAGYGPADPAVARRELDEGRPVGIFIRWTPTLGHFAALCGYSLSSSGVEFVVADPKYGDRPVLEEELLGGRYRGSGLWTHQYLTTRTGGL